MRQKITIPKHLLRILDNFARGIFKIPTLE